MIWHFGALETADSRGPRFDRLRAAVTHERSNHPLVLSLSKDGPQGPPLQDHTCAANTSTISGVRVRRRSTRAKPAACSIAVNSAAVRGRPEPIASR